MLKLVTIAMLLCTGTTMAQRGPEAPLSRKERAAEAVRVPEEADILARTLSPDSPYFYPRMMMRYMDGDETLTPDHYYYLYYGHAYDASYDAHKELPGDGEIARIMARGATPTREAALEIIEAAKLNMMIDPFSPGNMNLMAWACGVAGDTLGMRRSAARFAGVVGAITSSGTGARERSPLHILRFAHAGDVVAARGLKVERNTVRTRDVEYIQVERNPQGVKGYFFDFSRVYLKPHEVPRVERDRKWEFNGIPM
jgi:hypothetical protein